MGDIFVKNKFGGTIDNIETSSVGTIGFNNNNNTVEKVKDIRQNSVMDINVESLSPFESTGIDFEKHDIFEKINRKQSIEDSVTSEENMTDIINQIKQSNNIEMSDTSVDNKEIVNEVKNVEHKEQKKKKS